MKYLNILCVLVLVLSFGCLSPDCPSDYSPVCGDDGNTYPNDCLALQAGAAITYNGTCEDSSCLDSDFGKDVMKMGSVTFNSSSYSDSCYDETSVIEYSCANGSISSDTIECPSGNRCMEGACVEYAPEFNCVDSDGINYELFGKVVADGKTYEDSCNNRILTEYACGETDVQALSFSCPDGCAGGKCMNQKCTDTEGDKTIYAGGNVNIINDSGWFTFADKCVVEDILTEYSCNGDELSAENVSCPNGYTCSGGACYPDVACYDTDEGTGVDGRYHRGTVYYNEKSYRDYCMDEYTVVEYSCSLQKLQENYLSCPSGQTCSRGACVIVEDCEDTDGGKDYYERGTSTEPSGFEATDQCISGDTVLEFFCDGSEQVDSVRFDCPSGYACSGGACVRSSTCTDSDGGIDYYESGTSKLEGLESESDYCVDNTLVEFFCDGSRSIGTIEFSCPAGYSCIDGACNSYCTESDDGNEPEVFGETYFGSHTYADYCIEREEPLLDKLVEYYCDSDGLGFHTYEYPCSGSCGSGECIPVLVPE